MKHWCWLALLGVFLAAPWGFTSPTQTFKTRREPVPSSSALYFVVSCVRGEQTQVIASGGGRAPLGVYVFDEHGNCIAREEALSSNFSADDLAVEWYPPAPGPYLIELRNQGRQGNDVELVIQ
jgi:hypothetical protein